MRCDCCGKRKHWLESFEGIDYNEKKLNICVRCSTLVYKIRYSIKSNENPTNELEELNKLIKSDSVDFKNWFESKINIKNESCNK